MAFGSRGSKDFGLSSNMTLPITNSSIVPDPKVIAQNAFMPEERTQKNKKHARFALDSEEQEPAQRKPSWFKRLFRRSRKSDKSAPYAVRREEDEAVVSVVRSESDPELSRPPGKRGGNAEGGDQLQRRKPKGDKSDRKAKSLSTAFEHITPVPVTAGHEASSAVEVVFKPSSPTSSTRKVVLQYRRDSRLGLHLSGGLPPVTVTYIELGGQADLAGIRVGDIILEVNGIDCRKKVEVSQLMALKIMIQQASGDRATEQDIDEAAWRKMKVKQDELESDTSTVKITKLDSASEEDTASPRVVEVELVQPRKSKKKRISSTRASSGGELGGPLAASSPIREENDAKPKRKKKASNRSSLSADEVTVSSGVGKEKFPTEEIGRAKSSRKKVSSSVGEDDPSEVRKKKKKKKPNGAETSLIEDPAKSPVKKSSGRTKKSDISMSPPDARVEASVKSEDGGPFQQSISVDEVDGMDRSTRRRRSSSPKSRYHMGGSDSPKEQQREPGKVTVGLIAKEESKNDKKKAKTKASGEKKKKNKRKSTEDPSSRKVSKEKSQPSSRKVSAATKEPPPSEEPPSSGPLDLGSQSAAISGSIESNTLTFVSANKGSKSSLHHEQEKKDANTLPRRKSADHSRSPGEASVNHSTSFSNLKEETEKEFRNELREASRSQHDMPEAINASMTIEIDSNIKVKKSGLIKGKTDPSRPSIFDQSSSPEPDEITPISSGPIEDNILDSELKVKKSGVMVGRKTSTSSRPSILDEKSTKTSPSDIEPGEVKYNRKVSENLGVDLSAIPEISPSLGLVAGRDRRDASNRSLTKRRPASQRESLLLDSKEGEIMGTDRVDLSHIKYGRKDEKAVVTGGGSRLATARQLFEKSGQQDSGKYGSNFGKFERPGKASPNTKPLEAEGDKSQGVTTAGVKEGEKGMPSWIAIAKGRQKISEEKENDVKETHTPSRATGGISMSNNSRKTSVPQTGTVAQRMAMFQKR